MSANENTASDRPLSRAPYPRDWRRRKGWQKHAENRGGVPGRAVRHNTERRLQQALDRMYNCQVEIEILRYALAVERGQITPAPFPGTES